VLALLAAMALIPLLVLASDTPVLRSPCPSGGCLPGKAQWSVPLVGDWPAGTWSAGTGPGTTGDGGTVPAGGQAGYVAVGDGLVVVGTGLSLTGYAADSGRVRWEQTLTAPVGSQIVSVRAWSGILTVGVLALGGQSRTEVVLDPATGRERQDYPAAVLGGAVSASGATTVVIGSAAVTSYDNATGRVRWRRAIGSSQSWQVDEQFLYMTAASGGHLGSSAATALRRINLSTGSQSVLSPTRGDPFSGALAMAVGGVVLFGTATGVTAYQGSTGDMLWSRAGWVPEGTDPVLQEAEFTAANGTLLSVDPLTGTVKGSVPAAAVPGTAALYLVRGGVVLGLDSGPNGAAWGYDTATGAVSWTVSALPWPHFFSGEAGLGGSGGATGDLAVVTMCAQLSAATGGCVSPMLVALHVETGGSA
jgi:hypothetical protein